MAFDLGQCRDHNFSEIPLVFGVERDHGCFMCSDYGLTSSNYTLVGFGGQFISQKQQNQATLQKILGGGQHQFLEVITAQQLGQLCSLEKRCKQIKADQYVLRQ